MEGKMVQNKTKKDMEGLKEGSKEKYQDKEGQQHRGWRGHKVKKDKERKKARVKDGEMERKEGQKEEKGGEERRK